MKRSLIRMLSIGFAWLGCLLSSDGHLLAAVRVDFDQDEYVVSSPGETFNLRVLIDGDDSTPEFDAIPNGLFSFGAQITFDPTKASVGSGADIQIASALDQFGFSEGGFKEIGPGLAAGKGNIDSTLLPIEPYFETVLMMVTLTNQATAVDSYPLNLDFFRTLPPAEDLFVDAMLNKLDSQVTFGSARVRVIPEPLAIPASILAAALIGIVSRSRKAKCRRQNYNCSERS